MIVKIDCDKNEIKKLEEFDYSMMYAYPEIQSILLKVYKAIDKQRNKTHLDASNGEIPFTFFDALKEVCETEIQATRIYRCLRQAGIIKEIESEHATLDEYSDKSLMSIRNFGTISLIFARRANKLYQEKRTCSTKVSTDE